MNLKNTEGIEKKDIEVIGGACVLVIIIAASLLLIG